MRTTLQPQRGSGLDLLTAEQMLGWQGEDAIRAERVEIYAARVAAGKRLFEDGDHELDMTVNEGYGLCACGGRTLLPRLECWACEYRRTGYAAARNKDSACRKCGRRGFRFRSQCVVCLGRVK